MSIVIAVVSPEGSDVMRWKPAMDGVTFIVGNTLEAFQAHPRLAEARVLVFVAAGGRAQILDALWASLPQAEWVHSFFAGVDALRPFILGSLPAGVPVSNGKGAFSESLAEWALTAILHFNKQVPRIQANRRTRTWDKFTMATVAGRTLGVVGFGHIGQTTARLARAFGMQVLAVRNNCDPSAPGNENADEVLPPARKLELFQRCDFVVCALPGTDDTRDFCGAAEFAAMPAGAVFISVGRGLAVDEDALAAGLQAGSPAAAAVDVFVQEPLPTTSPLWDCENALLTSHNADFTEDYFQLGWSVFESNLKKFMAGEPLATPIDKGLGY